METANPEILLTLKVLKGNAVIPYLPRFAELRLLFYRNFPYLYEGTQAEEENYLSMYANSNNSLFVVAKKGDEVVGIVAGIPLSESPDENKALFAQKGISTEQIFYLGEMVFLSGFQNSDFQEQLYQQFETSIRESKTYNKIAVCEIERESPQKSSNAFPSEVFWENNGFSRQASLSTYYLWKDFGDLEKTDHLMIFWTKLLKDES